MIKNIIFDIAGVLVNPGEDEIIELYAKKANMPFKEARECYDRYCSAFERAELSQEEFTKKFFDLLGIPVPSDFWDVRLSVRKRYDEMFSFLEILKKKYRCLYLSNEGKEYWEAVDRKLNITENFEDGIISYQAGARKPEPAVFIELLERNNLQAKETVFVDDNPKNVEGAKEVGLTGLQFTSKEQLEKDLKELGMEF